MTNNNDNSSGSAFSGFAGGHDSVPGVGDVAPAAAGFANTGNAGTTTLGANLPHVDPNNFQGTVHWGPPKVVSGEQVGQLPPGGGPTGSGTS